MCSSDLLPDPDEPIVHVYAEGATAEDSDALEGELHAMIDEIMAQEEAVARS